VRLVGWATLLVVSAASVSALAVERAQVTLTYTRKGAPESSCPDEATFRGLVSARLGYDPFVEAGSLALAVELTRRRNEMVGRLVLTGEDEQKRGERSLRAGADECFELATSMALAAAVAVDPDAVRNLGKPTPPDEPVAPSQPKKPAPRPAPQPAPSPPPRPPTDDNGFDSGVRFELGGVVPVGIVPAPRGGLRLGAALDSGHWSVGLEGAYLFPSSRENEYGKVSAYVLYGSLVPCVHPASLRRVLLDFCAVGSLGALRGDASNVARSQPSTDTFATVGPRIHGVWMLSEGFGLGAAVDVPVTVSRVHLDIEQGGERHEVWASSPVGFVAGLSLVARLR
jgi:hypothetical protein